MRLSYLDGCPKFYKEEFDECKKRVAKSRKKQQDEIIMDKSLEKNRRDSGSNTYLLALWGVIVLVMAGFAKAGVILRREAQERK